jgi:hypothetical protein
MANLARVREVEVLPAAAAHLHIKLLDQAAARAAPLGFVGLAPIQHDRDQADEREKEADEEPDEERAALGSPDQRGREAEREQDDDELHSNIVARPCSATSWVLAADRPVASAVAILQRDCDDSLRLVRVTDRVATG